LKVKTPVYTNRFERELKLMVRRGRDAEKFKRVALSLLAGQPLPRAYADHPLKGGFTGWRDCHLEPDWILIYKADATQVIFGRTGTHSDLF
jgi:mRNA interferase YafQ